MIYSITIRELSLALPHKDCFQDFNCHIPYGSRIGIIGRNGAGKSSLLGCLRGEMGLATGQIHLPEEMVVGYVAQTVQEHQELSGGQRLNKQLSQALACQPNLLLLDEPTNHLDRSNRKSLMRMLQHYAGTLIVATHDEDLLRKNVDTFWHIDQGKIHVFHGRYDDYIQQHTMQRQALEDQVADLHKEKKSMHARRMKEQERAAKSKARGQKHIDQRKWPTVVSKAKASRAESTSGKKRAAIDAEQRRLEASLQELRMPEVIHPHFAMMPRDAYGNLVSIRDGAVSYGADQPIVQNVNLSVGQCDRVAIGGQNGSGKSTLLRAILQDPLVTYTGEWYMPDPSNIGYLDQHYDHLDPHATVYESVERLVPSWSPQAIRKHLNDFLFRKNEEVGARIMHLSGGEKVRLSLALIAAKPPALLVLDEVTNNLDRETKAHMVQVLHDYPGAMILISHEDSFLDAIGITDRIAL